MKSQLLIVLWASLVGSCAEQQGQQKNPLVATVPTRPSEEDRKEAHNRFEKALESAPLYSSEIRSSLIDNPFSHRASYRSGSAVFADLPKQFRCPHDAKIIKNLTIDGWQLVECDTGGITFYRRHAEADDVSRRCFDGVAGEKKKDIGDEFEILSVRFKTFLPRSQSDAPDMETLMERVSNFLPGDRAESKKLAPFFPLGAFEKAVFYEKDWSRFVRFYGLDESRRRLVQFDLRPDADCKRNPIGWARTPDHSIKLDSPHSSVGLLDEALSDILALLDRENN